MKEAPCAIFKPVGGEKMARREHQTGKLKVRQSAQGPEWYIRYRKRVAVERDGKQAIERREIHHALGLVKALPKRKAERMRDEIMREVNGQVYTIQSHVPWEEMCRLWMEKFVKVELRATTRRNYQQWLDKHLLPAFKGKKLCDIKPEDVRVWLLNLQVAPSTRKTIRGALASIFRRAMEWGYWKEASPLMFVRLKGGTVRPKINFTTEQFQRVLSGIAATPSKRYDPMDVGLIVETLASTGMRISECLGLRWEAIDLLVGKVLVVQRQCRGDIGEPKSEDGERGLPLGTLVERYRQKAIGHSPDDLVFTDREGRPIADNLLLVNYLTPILKKLGLKQPGVGWHTFRRMHLTGVAPHMTPYDLRTQAGHSSIEMTKIYIVDGLARRAEAVRKFQEECGIGSVQVQQNQHKGNEYVV